MLTFIFLLFNFLSLNIYSIVNVLVFLLDLNFVYIVFSHWARLRPRRAIKLLGIRTLKNIIYPLANAKWLFGFMPTMLRTKKTALPAVLRDLKITSHQPLGFFKIKFILTIDEIKKLLCITFSTDNNIIYILINDVK